MTADDFEINNRWKIKLINTTCGASSTNKVITLMFI